MKEPSDHLRTIQRRVDFLKSRTHKNSFDLAELGALEWALVNLQAQRKPLTDEELEEIVKRGAENKPFHHWFARAIEAAHGIKENT